MSDPTPRRERLFSAAGLFLLISFWSVSAGGAQELPLKRNLPGSDYFSCPEIDLETQPGPEERVQAIVLGSNADQALILGDQARARDLLARANELDPFSAELAYRYGRILEDLGETSPAIDQLCRALALGAEDLGIEDARTRMEALVHFEQPQVPDEAIAAFSNGVTQADLLNLEEATQAFGAAFQLAPDWADAVYNRGVIRDRQGDIEGAVADFQQYLFLRPMGEDGITVSQRIGQLQSSSPPLSPSTTLTLGMFLPGMGQFYSGRNLGGLTVLALAGGVAAAGFLIKEIETKCVGSVPQGGECPPDRLISEVTTKPYLTQSLIAAGAVTVIGAVEAFIKVRRGDSRGAGDLLAISAGKARVVGPSVWANGPRLNLSLVRVTF